MPYKNSRHKKFSRFPTGWFTDWSYREATFAIKGIACLMSCRDISLKRVRYQSKGYVNLLLQTHRCSLDRRAAWWRTKNGSYFCRPSRERAHLLGSLLRRVVTRRCRTWRFVAGRRLDKAINRGNNCGTRGIIRLQFRLPLMNRACVSVSTTSKPPRERGPSVSDSRKCGHVTVDAVKKHCKMYVLSFSWPVINQSHLKICKYISYIYQIILSLIL